MADTTLIARFDGDISGLQASTVKAGAVVDGFGKKVDSTSKNVSKSTNTIGLGFKALGGMIRSVVPFLDDATASLVMFGSMAMDSLKNAFDAISKFAGFVQGGLVIALAAAAAAFGYMLGRMIAGTDATQKALAALYRVTAETKKTNEALKGVAQSWETYEKAIKDATLAYQLFGTAQALASTQVDAAKKAIVDVARSLEEENELLAEGQTRLDEIRMARQKLVEQERLSDEIHGHMSETDGILHAQMEKLTAEETALASAQLRREIIIRSLTADQEELTAAINAGAGAIADYEVASEQKKAEPTEIKMDLPTQVGNSLELLGKIDSRRQQMQDSLMDFVASLYPTIEAVGMQFASLWTSFSQGFGDAVARAIVYGDDFGKAMQELGKQLLSTLISFLIQTVLNTLLYGILATLITGGLASGRIALQASIASAAAFAAAIETYGIAGFAAGPGLAVAAAAGTVAAATKGFGIGRAGSAGLGPLAVAGVGAFAEGGLITAPMLALIGEKGDEAVVPLDRLESMMRGGGTTQVFISLDDRTIAQAVVPWIPGIVHAKGVKGI